MTQTATVTQFPKERIIRAVPSEQQLARQAVQEQQFIDELVNAEIAQTFGQFQDAGLDTTNAKFKLSYFLIGELMRAAAYASADISHPFQPTLDCFTDIIEKNFGPIENLTITLQDKPEETEPEE